MSYGWVAGVAVLSLLSAEQLLGQELSRLAVIREVATLRGTDVVNNERKLGKVDDLLIELRDGKIRSLVITAQTATGMRTMEVPYELVTWTETARQFHADVTQDDLDKMPSFKRETIKAFESTGGPQGMPTMMAPPQPGNGVMPATELSMLKLRFLGGAEDKLRGMSVELYTGEVAFVTVSHVEGTASGAALHPLPWNAFRVFGRPAGPGRDPIPEATLNVDRARLAKAPAMRADALSDPRFRASVYQFHHVPKPRFESLR